MLARESDSVEPVIAETGRPCVSENDSLLHRQAGWLGGRPLLAGGHTCCSHHALYVIPRFNIEHGFLSRELSIEWLEYLEEAPPCQYKSSIQSTGRSIIHLPANHNLLGMGKLNPDL